MGEGAAGEDQCCLASTVGAVREGVDEKKMGDEGRWEMGDDGMMVAGHSLFFSGMIQGWGVNNQGAQREALVLCLEPHSIIIPSVVKSIRTPWR